MFDIVRQLHPNWFEFKYGPRRRIDPRDKIQAYERRMQRPDHTHYSVSGQDRSRFDIRDGRKKVQTWRDSLLQD